MSSIRLFSSNATNFSGLGIGKISDAISCTVTEERNGMFELDMEYPITGIRYKDLKLRNIIVCPPSPFDNPQAFRIYSISKAYNGHVTVHAQHISYDLSDVMVYNAELESGTLNPQMIWEQLFLTEHFSKGPFTFTSNLTIDDSIIDMYGNHLEEYHLRAPKSLRNLLLGTGDDTFVTCYVGDSTLNDTPEYKFDNYKIELLKSRGQNRGAVIKYKKNMTGFTQEESMDNVYTHVYPFFYADSISYTKDGVENGEQLSKEFYRLDLTSYKHTAYVSNPLIDTGIRDNDGNSLGFTRILPLDTSSLYGGMNSVTFTAENMTNPYYGIWGIVNFDYMVVDGIKSDKCIIPPGEEREIYCYIDSFDYALCPGVIEFSTHLFDITFLYPGVADHIHNDRGVVSFASKYITASTNYEIVIFDYDDYHRPVVKLKIKNVDKAEKEVSPGQIDAGFISLVTGNTICEIEAPEKTSYKGVDLTNEENIRIGCMQIENAAKKYIRDNRLNSFPVNLSVDMLQLPAKDIGIYDQIRLCDIVRVVYPDYNVSTLAKCSKTVYDAISERYTSLDFSNNVSDFAFAFAKSKDRQSSYYNGMTSSVNYLKWKDKIENHNTST